jgi:hypothetical protein
VLGKFIKDTLVLFMMQGKFMKKTLVLFMIQGKFMENTLVLFMMQGKFMILGDLVKNRIRTFIIPVGLAKTK